MSTLATNVILHPKVNQSLAILATTVGRDKVTRLLQYLARLVSWYLLSRGRIESASRFEGLKTGLANGRKVMRLFRPAEFLQSAVNLAQRPVTSLKGPGQIAHLAQIGRQIGYAGFHTADMIVWLAQVRFLKFDKVTTQRYVRLMYKFWFAGIVCSLVSSSASLVRLRADSRRFALSSQVAKEEEREGKSSEEAARQMAERRERGRALLAQRQSILSQLISDSLDVWIPATGLGYSNLNEGTLGAFGVITSYMGLQTQWMKHSAAGVKKSV
ncbi:hypothetical protein J008_00231 [Cryptococcus neoformans]|uniref:Peroxisomal biogenesis factor 11 n=2 Tax=Cryptococcus neoformans TaxID=5207 RepID=A0A854QL24_CRYNE|nr:hypothetical protein CNAG_07341 [Cryptococcus neoformans var. grubii H99]AUB21782.1 hypothetical protein CKF44_07341 [Cryptococcus neoformans var. grubii]OWT41863.1 hypothetical protein C362_00225 [Cryptococcus neoformans var. grubii Bt1]OWZ36947.1 hypothetical protein C347_00303 [Cryptococcus neoformans var. grubii AD2-60a]OWZ48778.1 hypothetical protein C343_00226 [Cryptococcus neoformans var. grubii C23]OWZ58711.1 hypothetical protein C368_00224 [Cryptococcus neoformans var. grubii 125.9|eukprot:XP_012047043.1 hypothetical protein CNAG_07341 [Cryptococcus neoformans var. grubii H99]